VVDIGSLDFPCVSVKNMGTRTDLENERISRSGLTTACTACAAHRQPLLAALQPPNLCCLYGSLATTPAHWPAQIQMVAAE
jgi:hypothetical protein